MSKGYILKLKSERSNLFDGSKSFAEPVPYISGGSPLIVFISSSDGMISHVASGKLGMSAGTGLRKLNITDIQGLLRPLSFEEITENAPATVRYHLKHFFTNGGIMSPQSFKGVIESLSILDSASTYMLNRFSESRRLAIDALPEESIVPLAAQKEAVSTALHISGIKRELLLDWSPIQNEKPKSFLEGLPSVYLREDAMISNDHNQIPGMDKIKNYGGSIAHFENKKVRLDIILTNRTVLEKQTGTDLIYYNSTYRSFVMVQYKAMEKTSESLSPVFRLPNALLQDEIARMEDLLKKITATDDLTNRNCYRLNENPFYIKICPRIILNPDEIKLTPGMYFSLDHWKFLETDSDLTGPRGGRAISYFNVGRYLDNTHFTNLVQGSWIGTTPKQSEMLEEIVASSLREGKAVMIAIKSEKTREEIEDEEEYYQYEDEVNQEM